MQKMSVALNKITYWKNWLKKACVAIHVNIHNAHKCTQTIYYLVYSTFFSLSLYTEENGDKFEVHKI